MRPSGMETSFRLTCDEDDVRIDVYLSERLKLPRSQVKALIEGGHVRIDDRPRKPSFKVKKDIEIEGEVVREESETLLAEDIPVKILYEDEYLLVIDKPNDMVVHPSLGHRKGTLVSESSTTSRRRTRAMRDRESSTGSTRGRRA